MGEMRFILLIKRSELLEDCRGPRPSPESWTLDELWAAYNTGETVSDKNGTWVGIKPPLRQVEQIFKSTWRETDKVKTRVSLSLLILLYFSIKRKSWQRFREIPDYTKSESATRGVSPRVILDELEQIGSAPKGTSPLSAIIKTMYLEKKKSNEKTVQVRMSRTLSRL